MEITLPDLWSAWPRCALCDQQFFSQESLPYQLDCLHLFCYQCIGSLWLQEGYYQCPFDGGVTYSPHYNYDLLTRMSEIYQWSQALSTQAIGGHFYWLKQKINTKYVPCRSHFITNSCYAKNCCNSHDPSSWHSYNCPLWDNCTRGNNCPYKHSWTVDDIYQTVTVSSAYTTVTPVVLQQMQATNPQMIAGANYQYTDLQSVRPSRQRSTSPSRRSSSVLVVSWRS